MGCNMAKYIVKDGHKVHDGVLYAPGDIIDCSDDIASSLRLVLCCQEKTPDNTSKNPDRVSNPVRVNIIRKTAGTPSLPPRAGHRPR